LKKTKNNLKWTSGHKCGGKNCCNKCCFEAKGLRIFNQKKNVQVFKHHRKKEEKLFSWISHLHKLIFNGRKNLFGIKEDNSFFRLITFDFFSIKPADSFHNLISNGV
jgi:hypothetical protein